MRDENKADKKRRERKNRVERENEVENYHRK